MDIELARFNMIENQVRAAAVLEPRVLEVLSRVPRERFVPAAHRHLAFAELCLPLGHGEVMMTPEAEGRTLQALDLGPGERVLEIGTGSGFLTACLARLARSVVSVDIFPDLVEAAGRKLEALGIDNVQLMALDATRELPPGRFDAVAVTGSLPLFDTRFVEVLKPGGRLFVITGSPPVMEAQLVVKGADDGVEVRSLFETNVPPLVNAPAPPAFRF